MPRVPPVTTATLPSVPLLLDSSRRRRAAVRRRLAIASVLASSVAQRSTHSAMPMPPPMHSVARPFLASRRSISCSSVTRTRAPEAPIGWPMAMAPPLTLTFAGSQPMSLLTAKACAANASLASIRSRSLTVQPAFSSALREAGIGPDAHDRRIDAGGRPGGDARQRLHAARFGFGGAHQHQRRGAVVDARGVGGGHRAVLVEGRPQLGDALERRAVRGCIRRRRRPRRPCGS